MVQSSSVCPISVEPWAECGPSWDLGPRAPVCSWEGPDMMLRLSQHWDHLSNRQADRSVSTRLESAFLGEHRCCSVTESCPTLCDPVDGSTPGFPVHHQLPEFTQTHVHRVSDAVQLSHPLSPPSPLVFRLSQHQGFFQRVNSSHQVAKVLELRFWHQSFQ